MISMSQLIPQGLQTAICSLNNSNCHGDCHMSYGYMVMRTLWLQTRQQSHTLYSNLIQQLFRVRQ